MRQQQQPKHFYDYFPDGVIINVSSLCLLRDQSDENQHNASIDFVNYVGGPTLFLPSLFLFCFSPFLIKRDWGSDMFVLG